MMTTYAERIIEDNIVTKGDNKAMEKRLRGITKPKTNWAQRCTRLIK
jgi:hypothetical protein